MISEPKVSISIIASKTVTGHPSLLREVADRPFKPILLLNQYNIFNRIRVKYYLAAFKECLYCYLAKGLYQLV